MSHATMDQPDQKFECPANLHCAPDCVDVRCYTAASLVEQFWLQKAILRDLAVRNNNEEPAFHNARLLAFVAMIAQAMRCLPAIHTCGSINIARVPCRETNGGPALKPNARV